MAKKNKKQFVCRECGAIVPKWMGRCTECQSWDSLEEIIEESTVRGLGANSSSKSIPLSEVSDQQTKRLKTGNSEFDRTLGGGFAPGSLVLIGGDPGIGKSTLLLQTVANLAAAGEKVLYVSGEESAEQVKIRSSRLEMPGSDLLLLCETSLSKVITEAKETKAHVMVIDSIQTMFKEELNGTPGSVTQIRECTLEFMVHAKTSGCITILVGHVTKDGQIAGPRILEHMVDTVIYFEGDANNQYRILRAIKNRFGATDEIGVFEMTSTGLQSVENPSMVFLQENHEIIPGSVISCNMEGSRALLFEIQALVSNTNYAVAQRVAMGIDPKRVTIILALLEKFAGVQIGNSDVFVSIAGGIKVNDPSCDLALAIAIASNHLNKTLPPKTVAIGELGLSGDIRAVNQLELRLKEVKRLGFEQVIIPNNQKIRIPSGLKAHRFSDLNSSIHQMLD